MSDSDDEYGPITATWGSQTPVANSDNIDAWKKLVDPDVKIGPNDLGSGNLHRRGHNYKPIDEEIILAQRLKVQIPKKKMQEAIQKAETNLGLPKSFNKGQKKTNKTNNPKASNTTDRFSTSTKNSNPIKHNQIARSTSSNGSSPSTLQRSLKNDSNWANSDLVEVPFWETSEAWNQLSKSKNTVENNFKTENNKKENWGKRVNSIGKQETTTNAISSSKDGDFNKINSNNDLFNFDCFDKNGNNQDGWDTGELVSWGSEDSYQSNHKSNIPPLRHSIHHHEEHSRPTRFSIRSKQRYSDTASADIPEPINYRHDGRTPIPTEIAPPPPPENRHLITINVELSDTIKIPVPIRELDDPFKLATEFGKKNNINTPKVIEALTKLFTSQKEMELKKRQRKLQKRNLPRPTSSSSCNLYNDPSFFSQYASSPAYQSPNTSTTTNNTFTNSLYSTLFHSTPVLYILCYIHLYIYL
ncbi:uncharacterized protein BX663DRAFT_518494 [Cokeromyces recurvatus]|uniref:uncharacterized protein n=1 Tax=Cokeromyces recurvatus TaxID=90255 RepID=UPI0022203593|nr:uncharacterized protein BX663DRAFT_518494 [Cokeromyces recurvatus]KAI7900076.1 hypothetical protein BX663DRAFT_518494 [Cokeromyces recurvatus]